MSASPTIVLLHGLAIERPPEQMLAGIEPALQARGYRTARTNVAGDGSLEELADRYWAQFADISGPLVLLCHSMGGLVARTFLLDDTRARRIQAIGTIGSPHHGTPLAALVAPFQRAYKDLTPKARARWNLLNEAQERAAAERFGIRCVSVCAIVEGTPRFPYLVPTHTMLKMREGPNDGLVSARSQLWVEHAFDVDLDHNECASIAHPAFNVRSSVDAWVRLAEHALLAVPDRVSASA